MINFAILHGKSMNVSRFMTFVLYEKADYRTGDIVCFRDLYGKKYCHRIVDIREINNLIYLTMKGDCMQKSMPFEINIPLENIEGKVTWSYPKI